MVFDMIIFVTPVIVTPSVSPCKDNTQTLPRMATEENPGVPTNFPWPLFVIGVCIVTVRVAVTSSETFPFFDPAFLS